MRRRALLLITAMAVAVVVASGVALASDIKCPNSALNLCIGTDKADTMMGTNQDDNMRGLGGGDTMHARDGVDRLSGGDGNDEVSAGPGNDTSVRGGAGNDSLSGGDGDDSYVFGGSWGADRVPSDGEDAGTDTLDFFLLVKPLDVDLASSTGRDEVFSDAGMLNFPATVEIENVTGGQARDVVRGNDAPNRFSGNGGNDELVGRGSDDVLSGGLGADAFNGGTGNDELDGGDGIDGDVYMFQDGWGNDNIADAAGTDRLFFGELTSSVTVNLATGTATDGTNTVSWTPPAISNVTGGPANDVLRGDNSGNTLNGLGGDDEMYGENDSDTVYGRGGNDEMFGGPGADKVYGDHPDFPAETGDDTIDVADGNLIGDTVDCGPGTDTVTVDVTQDLSGNKFRIDSAANCETIIEVLIN